MTGGRSSISLAASRDGTPEFAGDFHPAAAIAGGSDEAVLAGAVRDASVASLVIDEDDVLHLVWQSSDPEGIWYSRCSVKGKEPAAGFQQSGSSGREPMAARAPSGSTTVWPHNSETWSSTGKGNSGSSTARRWRCLRTTSFTSWPRDIPTLGVSAGNRRDRSGRPLPSRVVGHEGR